MTPGRPAGVSADRRAALGHERQQCHGLVELLGATDLRLDEEVRERLDAAGRRADDREASPPATA